MQTFTPLRSSIERFTTRIRSLRLWELELVAWWVSHQGDRADRIGMQRDIRAARREVRELIFLSMVSRMTFQKRARK